MYPYILSVKSGPVRTTGGSAATANRHVPVVEMQSRVIRSPDITPDEGNGIGHLLDCLIDYQPTGMIGLAVPNQGSSPVEPIILE